MRHGINIATNQRLSPTFRGNGNTIFVGDSQTFPLPIFPEGVGTSVHRLKIVPPLLALKIVGNICRRKGCATIVLVKIEQPIVGAEETARIASRGTTPQSATEIVNY